MKLSEEESRWLRTYEKREQLWPFTRWIVVLLGFISIAGGVFVFHEMTTIADPAIWSLLFIPFFFLGLGGLFFGMVIGFWRGDVKLRLLLRLIREHEDKN